jgi:hypothetical protein
VPFRRRQRGRRANRLHFRQQTHSKPRLLGCLQHDPTRKALEPGPSDVDRVFAWHETSSERSVACECVIDAHPGSGDVRAHLELSELRLEARDRSFDALSVAARLLLRQVL